MLTAQEIDEWDLVTSLTKEEQEKAQIAFSDVIRRMAEKLKELEEKEEDQ